GGGTWRWGGKARGCRRCKGWAGGAWAKWSRCREPPGAPASAWTGEDWSRSKAAGEVLTAKQAPHRPGTAPALGLRAGSVVAPIVEQTTIAKETSHDVVPLFVPRAEIPAQAPTFADHAALVRI